MSDVNYNDGLWHGWNGGECPVHPETVVEVCLDNSAGIQQEEAGDANWGCDTPHLANVIAFRVIREYKEPREFWITEYPCGEVNVHNSLESAKRVGPAGRNGTIIHVREVLE